MENLWYSVSFITTIFSYIISSALKLGSQADIALLFWRLLWWSEQGEPRISTWHPTGANLAASPGQPAGGCTGPELSTEDHNSWIKEVMSMKAHRKCSANMGAMIIKMELFPPSCVSHPVPGTGSVCGRRHAIHSAYILSSFCAHLSCRFHGNEKTESLPRMGLTL